MGAVWDHTTFYLKIELSDFILMSDFEKFFRWQKPITTTQADYQTIKLTNN